MSKGKSTSVALATTEGNSGVVYLEGLAKELQGLKTIAETPYKTSGTITTFGISVNIREEQNPENLTQLVGSVAAYENAVLTGRDLLGETSGPAVKFCGHLLKDIVHDVKLRKQVLASDARRKTLETLMEKSKKFMTIADEKALFEQELRAAGVTI